MDIKKLIMLVLLSSPAFANDANQGDFSNNTQAETITTTTSTVVSQEGTPVPTACLLYTSPSPRDVEESRMPSSA